MQPAEQATRWSPISTSATVRAPFGASAKAKLGALLLSLVLIGPAWADHAFSLSHWALEARFPDEPLSDGILTPSPQGDVKVQRFYFEPGKEHYLLARFEYPLAPSSGEAPALYGKSFADLLASRPGQVRSRDKFSVGPYEGEKLIVMQPREKTRREVRLVLVGATLYLASAEWPEQSAAGAAHAAGFFASLRIRAEFTNPRQVAENERWRVLTAGRFSVRYDATRWYRDPADREPGVFNLMHADRQAEAQFIAEPQPLASGSIEQAVLDTARAGAQAIEVIRQETKTCGSVVVTQLEFTARVDRTVYRNHGYFYTGPEGTVQLRGWAPVADYPAMAGGIGELLDGLTVLPATGK